jgi:RNA polymerase sigma-70 factor, ECF subfamily
MQSKEPGSNPSNESLKDSLVKRLDDGESKAFQDLFDQYSERLRIVVARNVNEKLAKRFDSEDVLQSAYRTFFRRFGDSEFEISNAQELWRLLVKITICKTQTFARRHTADKRNVDAEQRDADVSQLLRGGVSGEDAIALWEEVETALKDLPEQAHVILQMRLEGESKTEIGNKLDLSRQTIHRTLKLIHDRLEQRFNQVAGDQ